MVNAVVRAGAAAAALTLVSMLFVGSFLGALHDPAPHGLPVGVAGPSAAARQLDAAFARRLPGAFTVSAYPGVAAADEAIADRDADAVLVPGPSSQRLLIAGAAGRFVTEAVITAFTAEAAASGQQLTVTDIRPAPPGDPNAITALFFFLGLALPSAAFGIALAVLLGRRTPGSAPRRPPEWPARLAALACFSALAGATATWVSDGIVGALPGAPAALFGVGVLTAFAVSSACHAAWRLAGAPLAALLVLLFIPVGVPAAGGPFGSSFVTSWYADLGKALPAGAALPAVRDVVSFGGHALAAPLLVLCLWAGISVILSALPAPRRRGRSTGTGRWRPGQHGLAKARWRGTLRAANRKV